MTAPRPRWRHLYLAVPTAARDEPERWASALRDECTLRGLAWAPGAVPATILVGGEAPEVLGPRLPVLVREAAGLGGAAGVSEWTVEIAAPDGLRRCVHDWVAGGVTRVALRGAGAKPAVVDWLVRAVPGVRVDAELPIDASWEPGPGGRMGALIDAGASSVSLTEAEEGYADRASAWFAALDAALDRGWKAADLAAVHAPGTEPRHPRAIRGREPVLGLGPGAVTFRHPERRWNHRTFHSYLAAIETGTDPVAGSERLGRAEGRLERIWCRLRMVAGLRCPKVEEGPVTEWERRGWVRREGARILPTPAGWLQADRLAVELSLHLQGEPDRG